MNILKFSDVTVGGISLFGKQIFVTENNRWFRRFHISMKREAWWKSNELTANCTIRHKKGRISASVLFYE